MLNDNLPKTVPPYFSESDIQIEDLAAVCSQQVNLADYPLAADAQQNILIYYGDALRDALVSNARAVKMELARALKDGPGVLVIKRGYSDLDVIDRSTVIFDEIVAEERTGDGAKGDHFGNNERIWNAIQKVCLRDPDLFIDYYGNDMVALVCEAWLGTGYQITAQMNTVKPGNKAQTAHRDYHLGFQSPEVVGQFPAHAQIMSQYLTLQGAIAHVDMPLEMGPTRFLPFSQQYGPGYLAYTRPAFAAYFDEHCVQLPLNKGDLVFFSPALFHGAGSNQTEASRVANLIQISSAFGRTMETLDQTAMAKAVYPVLLERLQNATVDSVTAGHAVAAAADGYSFPTTSTAIRPSAATRRKPPSRSCARRWLVVGLRRSSTRPSTPATPAVIPSWQSAVQQKGRHFCGVLLRQVSEVAQSQMS
jgi:ectoine hydroxylase-related dioxygenase (phytanoyl-CoA dioxygenase family)